MRFFFCSGGVGGVEEIPLDALCLPCATPLSIFFPLFCAFPLFISMFCVLSSTDVPRYQSLLLLTTLLNHKASAAHAKLTEARKDTYPYRRRNRS